MSESHSFPAPAGARREVAVLLLVLLLHGAALWALQSGLHPQPQPPREPLIVPAELLSAAATLPAPPAPQNTPAPQPAIIPPVRPTPEKPRPTPRPQPAPKAQPQPATKPAPEPSPADLSTAPAPNAPTAAPTAAAPAAPAATAQAPTAPSTPAPPRVELPSSNAAYLNNPKPPYPALSKRMGEQGKVVLRVLISAEGLPQKVEISQSSGYDRLDRQAQEAVQHWRFVPGKRNGVPEAMWTLVPIQFVLE